MKLYKGSIYPIEVAFAPCYCQDKEVAISKKEDENQITINYTTRIWNKTFDKILVLNKSS